MQVAIITDRNEALQDFAQGLGCDAEWVKSAEDVLGRAQTPPWQLVVVDAMMAGMDYKAFVMDLLRVNAMLNTVVITDLGEEEFHEDSEGLGVLCAVPANAVREDGSRTMVMLRQLPGLG